MQTITRGLFVWTVLFGVCCMQAVPPQTAQSGLISGTIIAAGSIGIAALAGYIWFGFYSLEIQMT